MIIPLSIYSLAISSSENREEILEFSLRIYEYLFIVIFFSGYHRSIKVSAYLKTYVAFETQLNSISKIHRESYLISIGPRDNIKERRSLFSSLLLYHLISLRQNLPARGNVVDSEFR